MDERPEERADQRPTQPRRLDRAPAERYGAPTPVTPAPPPPTPAPPAIPTTPTPDAPAEAVASAGSMARAVGFAVPAGVIALFAYVGLAGPFAFSAGLVIVAIFAGRVIGLSAKAGGGRAITSDQSVVVALVVTLAWFAAAQVGTWVFARSEGGVLPIVDYLLQTFGPIVPLVAIASVLAAWWSAR